MQSQATPRPSGTRRWLGAALGMLLTLTVIVGTGPTAAAASFTVEVGDSVVIATQQPLGNVSVSPPGVGTATFEIGRGIVFRATAVGTATVTWTGLGVNNDTVTVVPARGASGTFRAVLPPPPPGPCIVVTANFALSFGDVAAGGTFRDGDVAPTLAGCSAGTINQAVTVRTTDAVMSSLSSLTPGCATDTPTTCTPAAGSFALAMPDDDLIVTSTPRTWRTVAGNVGPTPARFAVKLPPNLDPSFSGRTFSFRITFTALAA